jgi:hypothetical protein
MLSKALPALIYFVRVMKLGKRINLLMHKFDQTEGLLVQVNGKLGIASPTSENPCGMYPNRASPCQDQPFQDVVAGSLRPAAYTGYNFAQDRLILHGSSISKESFDMPVERFLV